MSALQLHTAPQPGMPKALLDEMRASGRTRIVQAGMTLFAQADTCEAIYLLEDGLVGLRKLDEDGTSILVGLARPGDFIGYGALLSGDDHVASAEILRMSRVLVIERAGARRMMRERPDFLSMLLRQATRDLQALEDKYLQMATRQAHERLAALLLSFKTNAGDDAARPDCRFELPLMNKDIADLIGIRPETLSRAIGQLRAAGLAELRDHVVHIPSVKRLAQASGRGQAALAA